MRGLSQNAMFVGDVADEPEGHPLGSGLAQHLAAALRQGGTTVSEPDNWRDSGWSFGAKVGDVEEEIVVARAAGGKWFVQVGPARPPSLLRQVFGPTVHPAFTTTFEIARAIHQTLSADGRFSDFRWRWDGPPRDDDPPQPIARPAG